MILPAVAAGIVCLVIVAADLLRPPIHGFRGARVFVAGAWGLCWLAYGVNFAHYPAPTPHALLLIAVGCVGSLLMVPQAPRVAEGARVVPRGRASLTLIWCLVGLGLFVLAWDVYHLWRFFEGFGWANGLKEQRLSRTTSTGAFWLPGFQVMRATVLVAGVLAFARWQIGRHRPDLMIAGIGFAAAVLSTGRWEVIGYVVWLYVSALLVRPPTTRPVFWRQMIVVGLACAAFFAGHGRLFGKDEHAARLASLPTDQRIVAAEETAPSSASTRSVRPAPAESASGVAPPSPPSEPPGQSSIRSCERWVSGLGRSNQSFAGLPPVVLSVLLYASGPFAALDRALCEGSVQARTVLFYWPHKIARVLGVRPAETLLAVDPYVDIGVPFNNFTVLYSFLLEVGPVGGPILWLALALAVRMGARTAAATGHPDWLVAAAAPLSMAIRTPWTNTYFDGTLLVWIGVASIAWMASRYDGRAARPAA